MTTETQDMLAALGQLHDDVALKLPQIDARLNAVLPNLDGAMKRSIYVNADTGSDIDGLGTSANPVKSLLGASELMVQSGYYDLILQTDLIIDYLVRLPGLSITFRSDVSGTLRRLSWASEIDAGTNSSPRILPSSQVASIYARDIIFQSAQASGHVFYKRMFEGLNLLAIYLWNCEFEVPAGSDIAFVGSQRFVAMSFSGVTVPAEMPGLWLENIAAGTDPATVPNLFATSLTAL